MESGTGLLYFAGGWLGGLFIGYILGKDIGYKEGWLTGFRTARKDQEQQDAWNWKIDYGCSRDDQDDFK